MKAVPNSIAGGETSALSGFLVFNSDAVDTTGADWVLDGTSMTFETDLGSVGSPSVLKETNSGGASATLTADEGPGTANVSVTVDQEHVAATVEITSAPPTPTPTLPPTDSPTPTGTPGPTGTPTDTPTASPTPTPTGTPGPELTQGDVDCDGDVDGNDGVKLLAGFLELSYSRAPSCPGVGEGVGSPFGDVNCVDGVNPFDALAIFAHVAGLIQDNGVCTDIGDPLS